MVKTSELLLGAKEDNDLIGFLRVVGDSVQTGIIVDYTVFEDYDRYQLYEKMSGAAEILLGRKLSILAEIKKS